MRLPLPVRFLRGDAARQVLTPLAGWPSRAAVAGDVLLWLLLSGVNVAELLTRGWVFTILPMSLTLQIAGAVLLSALVVGAARPYPLAALIVAIPASVHLVGFVLAVVVLSYLVGRRMPRVGLVGVAGLLVVSGSAVLLIVPLDAVLWLRTSLVFLFVLLLPWLVGVQRRQNAALADAGWARAKQLEHEQRIVQDQARLRERSRIAQDMHDSLGHELSLLALRAGALEVAPDSDERHRKAAGELRANATEATERLREIIGVLRDESDPLPLDPAEEGIAALVERARASGVEVRLERHGEPVRLSAMVDRAAHRVVQEALTNATKHAPGAPVLVRLLYDCDGCALTVRNGPPPGGAPQDRVQGGRGLVALAERVRLAGGAFHAGERAGGFLVWARFGPGASAREAPEPLAGEEDLYVPSVSAEHRRVQRRMRHGLVRLVATVAVLVVVLMVFTVGAETWRLQSQTLAEADFRRMSLGQERSELEETLPLREYPVQQSWVEEPPEAEGGECLYYQSSALMQRREFYRLCFVADVLVAKDTVRLLQ